MGVCDLPLMTQVCDAVGGVVSSSGSAITDGIGAWIAKSMGELAATAADLAARAVDATTAVDLNASWFRSNYELLLPIGLVLTVGTFCLALIRAAWRRDGQSLAQAVTGTMTGVFFAFVAIGFTTVALTVVDALSAGLFQAANTSIADTVRRMVKVSELGAMFQLGWAIPALVGLGAAIGAFLYWGVMIFRKVGILILVTLAIFAGAGGGWEFARRWRRGWIEATATLVVSKLLMTIVFLIGISAMGQSDTRDGMSALSDMMAGIVVMVLVLLSPFATYKFVHWASDSGGGDDAHRSSAAGLATAAGAVKTAGSLAMQARVGRAPQGPARVPGMGADGVASGIDPTGGTTATTFRFGENPTAPGDRGRPLIRRPRTDGDRDQPLIRRASPGSEATAPVAGGLTPVFGEGSDTSPPPVGGSEEASVSQMPQSQGVSPAPGEPVTFIPARLQRPPTPGRPASPPAINGPSAQGTNTPQRWIYPDQPPTTGPGS